VTQDDNADKFIPFTFFDDVMQNKMVLTLNYDIVQGKSQIISRFDLLQKAIKKKSRLGDLFDRATQTRAIRVLEKSGNTAEIEKNINRIKKSRDTFVKWENFQQNYFIMVDNTDIQHATITKFDEWLSLLGELVRTIATKELNGIVQLTEKYNKDLNKEINDKESLQEFLAAISEIKNTSMEMEFRINEV
jgi:hypothetical protein